MSKSMLAKKRALTLQPSSATVPDLSQTRERIRRRHDCQSQTFAETLSSLAGRTRCRAALINENCISCVFSTFSFLSASGMALNHKKLGT